MATKRGTKKMATRRAPSKEKAGSNGKRKGDIVLGPAIVSKQRVPIDKRSYARKESEIAQLEVKVRKLRTKIKPDQVMIAEHRETISKLTEDIENETEEREVKVRNEYHYKTGEVRVLRADDLKEIDRRTMTADEVNRQVDVEDKKLEKATDAGAVEPDDDEVDEVDGAGDESDDATPAGGEEVVQ